MDKTLFMIFAHRTLDYEKDPDPENWRTIKGAHVHVDNEGKIDGGAGGKFNGRGALPRSLFPGQGKAKQTEFAEVTAKRKENEAAAKKAAEAAKVKRKKERAAAQKAKREEKRKLENERPRLKQKFNDLREAYHNETDKKRKNEIIKELKNTAEEYQNKYGKHPDEDDVKLPEKKSAETTQETNVTIPAIEHDAFEDEEKAFEEMDARRDAWKNILSDPNFEAAQWQDEGGMTYVISKSIKDGEWQLSYFDKNGDATGDKQADSPIEFLDRVTMGMASQNVTVVRNNEESFKPPKWETIKEIYKLSKGLMVYTDEKSEDPKRPYVIIDPQYGKITTKTSPEEALKRLKTKGKEKAGREEENEIPW